LCETRQVRNGNFTYDEKKIKETCTKILKNIPKEAMTPLMPGNLAGSGVSTQEETILNPFNVLHRSNQIF